MNRMVIKSRIGADGVLHVEVPVGAVDANREVQVTIEPTGFPNMTQGEWRTWVEAMAGSIDDPSFRRHNQGDYEQRKALS